MPTERLLGNWCLSQWNLAGDVFCHSILMSHNLDPHKESAINEGTEAGTVTRSIINFTEFSLILCPGQFHMCCQGSRGLPHAATQPGHHTRQHASSVGHDTSTRLCRRLSWTGARGDRTVRSVLPGITTNPLPQH